MSELIRLDQALKLWGLAPSRSKAQELIREGSVEIDKGGEWSLANDESLKVDPARPMQVRLRNTNATQFVSRAGRKLDAALEHWQIDVSGLMALDIGISTGGFAQCLLLRGAKHVVGIDVGHDQLAPSLRDHKQITLFEGRNAKNLSAQSEMHAYQAVFDLLTVDVSFISLSYVLPQAPYFLKPQGHLLALIKPQFEAAAQDLNKKGVLLDQQKHLEIQQRVQQHVEKLKFEVRGLIPSALPGQDGNQEYFIYAIYKP